MQKFPPLLCSPPYVIPQAHLPENRYWLAPDTGPSRAPSHGQGELPPLSRPAFCTEGFLDIWETIRLWDVMLLFVHEAQETQSHVDTMLSFLSKEGLLVDLPPFQQTPSRPGPRGPGPRFPSPTCGFSEGDTHLSDGWSSGHLPKIAGQ